MLLEKQEIMAFFFFFLVTILTLRLGPNTYYLLHKHFQNKEIITRNQNLITRL